MRTAKNRGPQKPPKPREHRGQSPHRSGKKSTRDLCKLQLQCEHCGSGVHTIRFCGMYRVCAVCDRCDSHRRLGGRIAKRAVSK